MIQGFPFSASYCFARSLKATTGDSAPDCVRTDQGPFWTQRWEILLNLTFCRIAKSVWMESSFTERTEFIYPKVAVRGRIQSDDRKTDEGSIKYDYLLDLNIYWVTKKHKLQKIYWNQEVHIDELCLVKLLSVLLVSVFAPADISMADFHLTDTLAHDSVRNRYR